ncbi:hypothetical protein WKI68_00390 [Streptomyces sp. MS1.HAVA.3]|uniref:Lipoprotein n=1 Tax=Streptomyces caledonius TaxID=3134107 RepID=A0ABU8TXE4_9ACTN
MLEDVDVVTAADPSCQPLADLRSAKPKRTPTGTAWAALQAGGGPAGGSVVLTSYAKGEAKAQMGELKAALTTCKDFSASSRRGWSERATLVALPSVEVGDESVSFSTTGHEAPDKHQIMTIVRTGGCLAVYLTPSDGNQPPASLMERQHEKLEAAG